MRPGSGSSAFFLVANSRQSTSQLAGSALDHAHQLCNGFVVGRQGRQYVDLIGCEELALECSGLDLELVLTLGEFLEDTGGSARMLVGERNQGRAFEHVVEHFELSAGNGAASQGVTYDTYVYASFAGLFTESGHSGYGHA